MATAEGQVHRQAVLKPATEEADMLCLSLMLAEVSGCGAGEATASGAPAEGVGQGVDRAPARLRTEDGMERGGGVAVRPVLAEGRRGHVLFLRLVLLAV